MQTRYLYLLRFILLVSDLCIINFSFWLSYYIVDRFQNVLVGETYQHYLIVCNLMWLFATATVGSYRAETVKHLVTIFRTTWRGIIFHAFIFMVYLSFWKNSEYSRQFLFTYYGIAFSLFIFSRFIGTSFEMLLKKYFNIRKSVAVFGMNDTAQKLANYFVSQKNNYQFEGFMAEQDSFYVDENGILSPGIIDSIKLAADTGIEEIYVSVPPDRMNHVAGMLEEAEKQCVRLKLVPDFSTVIPSLYRLNYMGDFPVVSSRKEPLDEMENRFKKRLFDVLFSSLVIVFLLSWLYPILAIIIKTQSPGPVLFKQQRSGRNNNSFGCYKFRSMRVNTDSDSKQATKNDSRITQIGAFLRKTSLDELPQFFNVLMGDMSVVGPRPHMLKHTEEYSATINQFMIRHLLKPGITGWAQVNGFRGETKESIMMEKRVEFDIWYLENWSFQLDVKIVFLTFWNIIIGEKNAY